jgi:outer membrane protein, heavy metal efflux system
MHVTHVETCLSRALGSGVVGIVKPATRVTVRGGALWVVVALCGPPGARVSAQEAPRTQPLTLVEARALAHRTHPVINAARQAVEVTAGLDRQSGAYPNPTVSFAREQTSGNGGTNWQNIATFEQPIEIGGQRGTRQAAARHRRTIAEAHLALVEAQLDFDVGRAYALALAADDRMALADDATAAFFRAREIAAARFAQGDISGYEYRRIGLEAGRYAALRAEMTLARHTARVTLATLIAPSSESISAFAAGMHLVDSIATAPVDQSLDSLIVLAFRRRADLHAADSEVDASIADARLAGRQAIPTPTVALGFKNERPANDLFVSRGFTFQLAFPLPLWNRHRGATEAASAETQRLEATRDELHRNIRRDVEHAWRVLVAATEQLDALRPLLGAEAQLALGAASTAYAEGEVSLVEWLDAVRAYHEAQSRFASLQADYMISRMALERAVGSVLSGGADQ